MHTAFLVRVGHVQSIQSVFPRQLNCPQHGRHLFIVSEHFRAKSISYQYIVVIIFAVNLCESINPFYFLNVSVAYYFCLLDSYMA